MRQFTSKNLFLKSLYLREKTLIRMIIITALCLIFLIQHILLMPFQFKTSNYLEILSLSLLNITAVINLLKASLTDSGIVPSGPTVPFFKSLELGEKMFVLLIIAYILLIELNLRRKKKTQSTDQTKKWNHKYTNPARGILDFCKQNFYRPLPWRPWIPSKPRSI